MNNRIGMISAAVHLLAVLGFILFLAIGSSYGNYICGMIFALSFMPLICAFAACHDQPENKAAANIAIAFSSIYVVIILLVYFANVTTIIHDDLNQQAYQIISTQKFGLFFDYDLLGYGVMSLSAFFIGLTIDSRQKKDKCLKILLIVHGIFFVALFIPMLGLFSRNIHQSNMTGPIIQTVWGVYFAVIDILAFGYFNKRT